ncbi:hypothetical protein O181_082429 [Austropuccinia psidii MF-1]|uniref:Uncharacterized protein n=1 Tax=Austropuccinia psidii MF-1 TaxID=1389203 RepID=A0A9Q3FP91_9BASI|nr:hypothetical protein [Austropuccinia psidii MF-1]
MTAPSQDTYVRAEQESKLRPAYGGQCGKTLFENILKPVTDFKRKINLLEKDFDILSSSKSPLDLEKLSIWIGNTKLNSAQWKNLHQLFGKKLSFSTAYQAQTNGLASRMIQTLEDMVRETCEYGLEFGYCDGFPQDWCTLLPELELAYKNFIHDITNQTPSILEKEWNSRLPQDYLRKDLV